MANIINRQQTFSTNGTVTAAGLHNLIDTALVNSAIIKNQQEITTIGTADLLLVAPDSVDASLAPRKVTVQNLFDDGLTAGTFTSLNLTGALTYGTATGNRTVSTSATITTGTIQSLTSSTANISQGSAIFTQGTIGTLNSTTGTIGTLNSTTGTIATGTIPTLTAGTTTSTAATITTGTIPTLVATTLITTGTGAAAAPAIVPTGDTNTGIFFPAADTIAFSEGGTEGMRIDSSGNVGIGTASPNSRFVVTSGTSPNRSQIIIGSTGLSENFYDSNTHYFRDGSQPASERMRIDSSGNVGIGTTSPSGTLHSVSTSSSVTPGIFAITATSSTATPAVAVIKQDALNTTNQSFVLFKVGGGTNCGKINANGANTAAFGSTSDARLKENITALPSQIDNVCALRPCEFDYKDGSGHQIGFIAQEMQEVYPDSVGVGDDGMLTITAWSKTEARLVKAIQELKAKNDLLEARLEALEAK